MNGYKTNKPLAYGMLIASALWALFLVYIGMVSEICMDIETYSIESQKAMELDAHVCALPWYERL